jgi:membrane complex biogenesis BtpA family protein
MTADTAAAAATISSARSYGGLDTVFWARRPLIGMVHLAPLPGSARDGGGNALDATLARAAGDAAALARGGADAVLVENFFDAPFAKDRVPPHTVAAMTRAVEAVRIAVPDLPVGVNVLRNDVIAALAIAHACGARFVRVNVYVGAAVTDQGIIEGAARDAVLYRRTLGADVAIFADVFVKHAALLGTGVTLEDAARDAVERGLADALIVSWRGDRRRDATRQPSGALSRPSPARRCSSAAASAPPPPPACWRRVPRAPSWAPA